MSVGHDGTRVGGRGPQGIGGVGVCVPFSRESAAGRFECLDRTPSDPSPRGRSFACHSVRRLTRDRSLPVGAQELLALNHSGQALAIDTTAGLTRVLVRSGVPLANAMAVKGATYASRRP